MKQSEDELLTESWAMLMSSKRYWLIPFFVTLLLFGLIVTFGRSGAETAPLIYTLFY